MRVLLITGFLGAGKTTFVNALINPLRQNSDIAVLVNDFGEESVSAEYGTSSGMPVRYLESGCICCAIGPSLINTIKDLLSFDNAISTIVIELNGIARPDQTKQTLNLVSEIGRQSTCCVIDTSDFETAVSDQFYREILTHQVAHSDFVFLNSVNGDIKANAGEAKTVRRRLTGINPRVSYLDPLPISLDQLFPLETADPSRTASTPSVFQSNLSKTRENHSYEGVNPVHLNISFRYSGTPEELANERFWASDVAYQLVRAKVIAVADSAQPQMVAQFAGRRWKVSDAEEGGKQSPLHNLARHSLAKESLVASVVLRGAGESLSSQTTTHFLEAMTSRVLNLCVI